MTWLESLKSGLPDYAKDIKLNLDSVILRSSLDLTVAHGCALAAAMATGNGKIVAVIHNGLEDTKERDAAMAAASIMAQNNVWYPYTEMVNNAFKGMPLNLRMNVISSHGGTTKENFEAYSLAASIIGKCHFCVKAHFDTLKNAGWTLNQLQDVGRVAAVINAACIVLNG